MYDRIDALVLLVVFVSICCTLQSDLTACLCSPARALGPQVAHQAFGKQSRDPRVKGRRRVW